jgi:type I restriction enzyme M protein
LIADTGERIDMIMTNLNFGKESTITVFGGYGNGKADKQAIIYETGFLDNYMQQTTQFLEHVSTFMKINGRAAIIVPDNVLFEVALANS